MTGMDNAAWLAAARHEIRFGPVTADQLDSGAHRIQHPDCALVGRQERVFTRCCGKPIPLPRPMWPCEIRVEAPADCCERSYPVFGEPA